jgi:hypothetical protein
MKITNVPVVNSWELEEKYEVCIYDCDFAQEVNNDSYVLLDLTLDRLEQLREDLEWQEGKGESGSRYARGLRSEIKIIEGLRDIGYEISILVYVSW